MAILHKGRVALAGKVKDLTAGKGYRLNAAQVPDALIDELRRDAGATSIRAESVEFHFPSREDANAAIDRLRSAGCEIESVVPTTSTLEEVFLKTIDAQ